MAKKRRRTRKAKPAEAKQLPDAQAPEPTRTKADLARALCLEFPDIPSRTLAKRLYRENKFIFKDVEAARSAVRYARGNWGKHSRNAAKNKTAYRDNEQAGWTPELPPSDAEPWTPFVLEGAKRVLSLSDLHIPYHDSKAIEASISYAKRSIKPDVLLLNGDLCDFYTLSRYQKNPKKRKFVREVEMCEETLEYFAEQFPKARRLLKIGNHEERYDHFIWNNCPDVWGLPQMRIENLLHCADYGFEVVKDKRPVMAGKLPVWHGHELPRGLTSAVNPARGAFTRTNDTCLVAHHHRSSSHPEYNWKKEEIVCWSQGCLCDMNPEYARINKWNLGFAWVEVYEGGEFEVNNYQIQRNGKVRRA